MEIKGLDDYITHDWRDDEEFNPDCDYYNSEKDVCNFPTYPGNEKIFGRGCLGEQCQFYSNSHITNR